MIKIVNVYIVYDLDVWPRNPNSNLKLKNCLFGANNVVKKSDDAKYVYSRYGKTEAGIQNHVESFFMLWLWIRKIVFVTVKILG